MNTLLIPFFDDDAAKFALSHAVLIAKRFNSHIEGVFITPNPPIVDGDIGMAMTGYYAAHIEKEIPLLAERAKSCFESVLAQHNITLDATTRDSGAVSASWRDWRKSKGHLIGDDGRVFDLIVVGRGYGQEWTDWNIVCESALFESGRPVLIATSDIDSIGNHVAIAWNRSTETSRAVALSMPVLHEAKKVSVITLDGWAVPGPDGEQLVDNLVRGGINASIVKIEPGGRTAGQALVDEANNIGADLLVKGAYTHSRLRQLVFGGATRHILQEANLPVIMAH